MKTQPQPTHRSKIRRRIQGVTPPPTDQPPITAAQLNLECMARKLRKIALELEAFCTYHE